MGGDEAEARVDAANLARLGEHAQPDEGLEVRLLLEHVLRDHVARAPLRRGVAFWLASGPGPPDLGRGLYPAKWKTLSCFDALHDGCPDKSVHPRGDTKSVAASP